MSNPDSSPSSTSSLRKIPMYPHFDFLNNIIHDIPLNLTDKEYDNLAIFLNRCVNIQKIEYLHLIELINDFKLLDHTAILSIDDISCLPKVPKLLRTSRNFPHFTILRGVSELPTTLPYLQQQKLAEFLDDHSDILPISYDNLCKLTHVVLTTQTELFKGTIADKNETCAKYFIPNNIMTAQKETFVSVDSNFENSDKLYLEKVNHLPEDLEEKEYQKLSSYMSMHPEILKINYFDLLDHMEERTQKRRRVINE